MTAVLVCAALAALCFRPRRPHRRRSLLLPVLGIALVALAVLALVPGLLETMMPLILMALAIGYLLRLFFR